MDYLEIIEDDSLAIYHITAGSCQAKSGVLEISLPMCCQFPDKNEIPDGRDDQRGRYKQLFPPKRGLGAETDSIELNNAAVYK